MTQDNDQLDEQLLSPEYFADPYPVLRRLREEDPVHWCEPWNCWVVSRYTDVLASLRQDGRQFSAAGRFGAFLDALPEAERPRFQPIKDHYSVGLLHSDPPDHTRLRGLVNRAFTPQVMDGMRPRIEAVVDELLEAAEAAGHFDLIGDFAFHLPAIVTAVVVGMPPEERHQFKAWSDDVAAYSASNRLTLEVAENALRSLLESRAYLLEIAARRRTEPRDDLISRLVGAEDDGLSRGELLSTCVTFLVGGHETTTALLASGLLGLFRDPEQLAALRVGPAAIATAVEEFLRYESPNQRIVRLAREDIEIEGRRIRRGQQVMFLLGSANRDPDQFPDPDCLDIHRSPNRHLAFAAGPHACFGMRLARLEAEIAFNALLRRFPKLRLTPPEPEWVPSYQLRMLKSLPVAC
jgi:cytochrome P450